MSLAFSVQRAACIRPQGIATRYRGIEKNWREFAGSVSRLATGIAALCGEGGRVAVLAANSPRNLEIMYAVHWCGAVLVPLNTRLSIPELQYIIEHAEIDAIVCDDRFRETALALVATRKSAKLVDIDEEPSSLAASSYDQLLQCPAMSPVEGTGTELGSIFYTGGTTGKPKGVMHSRNAWVLLCMALLAEKGFTDESVHLHSGPMFHIADLMEGHAVTLAGGSHTFLQQFDTETFLKSIRDEGSNALMLVPTMIAMILDRVDAGEAHEVLKNVRWISYGGSSITPALLNRVIAALPKAQLFQCYGLTEAPASTILTTDRHVLSGPKAGKLLSAGRPFSTCAVRVVNEHGEDCAPGEPGEILLRTPSVMMGYWKDPEQTAATLHNGWVRTGDAGTLDEDGFLTIMDRIKDMIVTGGENVYSAEVEGALATHPSVAACAVIGIPDQRWGEAVHAVVVLKVEGGATEKELVEHCRARIANYKCPKSFEFRVTPLPLSGVGKVAKNELRAQRMMAARSNDTPKAGPQMINENSTLTSTTAVDAAITSRRAVRAFLKTPVPRKVVEDILSVASRAPSGVNIQPWKVQVLTGKSLENLSNALLKVFNDPEESKRYTEEYPYYPTEWISPYIERRRKVGFDMYGLLEIGRGEKQKMHEQMGRNYKFFDAPVGLIFSVDRILGRGAFIDYGTFLQNIMIAARARGLDTCPQAAFAPFHRLIEEHFGLKDTELVLCGMSLGYADTSAPIDKLETVREPVSSFTTFHD